MLKKILTLLVYAFCALIITLLIVSQCFQIPYIFALKRLFEQESNSVQCWGVFDKRNNQSVFNQMNETVTKRIYTTWFFEIRFGNYSAIFPVYTTRVKTVSHECRWIKKSMWSTWVPAKFLFSCRNWCWFICGKIKLFNELNPL